MDKDGKLSMMEFSIAMHLIVCKSKRGMPALPTQVESDMFPTLTLSTGSDMLDFGNDFLSGSSMATGSEAMLQEQV